MTLDDRIDELYGLPLDRFTAERDAIAKELASAGDKQAASQVKALRKPVASMWALNVLRREEPTKIDQLIELGKRLRDAHRRAVSGGDVEAFRGASDDRRKLISALTRDAAEILDRTGAGSASQADDVAGTLEAATVDDGTAELLRSGRLTKPVRPPADFGGGALRVVPSGKRSKAEAETAPQPDTAKLRRELSAAEARERRTARQVERERQRLDEIDLKRSEARDRLRAAEAELRGASLERKRLESAVTKHSGS
ncbi:MAG TPA: hypothetical protein VJ774_01055 [Actinomycetota bacterium]|nr:hypothetical protein [Actinomycetota bacterium]